MGKSPSLYLIIYKKEKQNVLSRETGTCLSCLFVENTLLQGILTGRYLYCSAWQSVSLKVLSSEMDPPLKYESASYFSIANYAINLDSCGEYSLCTWSTFDH
jgi:hypothetical protein